ncbi:response regulator [Anaerocolumna aminovalerica]|jgi:two-component system response regulator YesN|uniref:Stage 0 sporulation protein A homolog n=1 Tax=Anaerocolumna aminovalerica TaxID=1527 RepID=A0A1I5D977_9FIRM|nr:response regulator [Anaerocolumna aminovalerica]MBU5332417.1 response regulator [Anaerocolumna aminovalerica]MDU6263097.1 response regulator [Anaerocolumna aminovalerica]SFN95762.1 Helix-turn-helix domain-containing protein [Anaerocolumna aminovalerica]
MYKVVIIDDEPIIVEGISRMISWDQYDCTVVATANDGNEGGEVIRKYKPHIVITDIAMPDLDGLTMIAGLKSEFDNIEISILTGYRKFEYARQAINLGVTRFLLKPSSMEEIEEAIKTMVNNLKSHNILPDIEETDGTQNTKLDSEANNFIVNNAMKYIEQNYAHKITLSEVAEKTYVSQWHLSKLLNRNLGQNFSEILNNIRIREAIELLRDPSLRIGDISEKVGFVDLAHFSRIFKKKMGISANEYRNTILESSENKKGPNKERCHKKA